MVMLEKNSKRLKKNSYALALADVRRLDQSKWLLPLSFDTTIACDAMNHEKCGHTHTHLNPVTGVCVLTKISIRRKPPTRLKNTHECSRMFYLWMYKIQSVKGRVLNCSGSCYISRGSRYVVRLALPTSFMNTTSVTPDETIEHRGPPSVSTASHSTLPVVDLMSDQLEH